MEGFNRIRNLFRKLFAGKKANPSAPASAKTA